MNLIDGKATSNTIDAEIASEVAELLTTHGVQPGLAVVLVGDDGASRVYVRNKAKRSTALGLHSVKRELPADTTQEALLAVIDELNNDPAIHGILVQSPPPPQIDEREVIESINPAKDVDCFHPYNVGKLLIGDADGLLPCTPAGIVELLRRGGYETAGKHAVVIGRSNLVGKPLAALLSRKANPGNCTVTLCHSRTQDLPAITRQGDILIAAIGRANFVTGDMVKPGAVVIDVGINCVDDATKKKGYRLVGDVDFEAVAPIARAITPVPGGVGPMTITMLLRNTITACKLIHGIG
ncbi:MAG: methylenetetrahydrofolate dehydrogenase (NADP+)/methenyltetrahydrofolate cyclohydrolase [Rhodothermales bacterium]|jgi:methylenetetrahydrofolate dehydrogenase (NADP+)/methenyltetrahydrofolate cyclohydrolase